MLVLTRKPREVIFVKVGETTIKITLCALRGDGARIGIDAPRECPIMRAELLERGATMQTPPTQAPVAEPLRESA